jgi:hypothetical protein
MTNASLVHSLRLIIFPLLRVKIFETRSISEITDFWSRARCGCRDEAIQKAGRDLPFQLLTILDIQLNDIEIYSTRP